MIMSRKLREGADVWIEHSSLGGVGDKSLVSRRDLVGSAYRRLKRFFAYCDGMDPKNDVGALVLGRVLSCLVRRQDETVDDGRE